MEGNSQRVQIRIRKVKYNEILLDFSRNKLSKQSFHYSKEHGYYIAESAQLGNLKVTYLLKIKENNIEKYLNKNYPNGFALKGIADEFSFEFTSTNIRIYNYHLHPEARIKREELYKSDDIVLKYIITGNYYNFKSTTNHKARKKNHFYLFPGNKKGPKTPFSTSGWSAIHPYGGGGFSPR